MKDGGNGASGGSGGSGSSFSGRSLALKEEEIDHPPHPAIPRYQEKKRKIPLERLEENDPFPFLPHTRPTDHIIKIETQKRDIFPPSYNDNELLFHIFGLP